ncbi:MAG TPA: pitrilysin family protein [Candidatus Limnocylindrales bacterium]|nr:pitrilysin family protein [Candidatus Limnocylindrales bacterium]
MKKRNVIRLLLTAGMALAWTASSGALAQKAPAAAGKPAAAASHKQTPPPGGPPKPFNVPPRETFTLPNGMHVTLVPYGNLPKATVMVTVRAGGLNEPGDQVWISDITGTLMKEGGTTSRTSEQVAQQAASMGGSIEVGADADQTQVYIDVLSEFAPKAVDLLADVVQHPLLPESELGRIKQDFLRNLAIEKSRSQPLAREAFMKALYPDHPYGRVFPTEEMLKKYTIADVQKFYKGNFGAQRTHIYVAGKFDAAAVKKTVMDSFSAWAKGPEPLINVPKTSAKHEFTLIDRPNAAQSTVYIGLPTIDPSSPDYVAMSVMNTLLGGSFGSRITSNIREQKGYTYSPFSQLAARYRSGYWAEVADVTTAVTGPSIKEILGEIERLQKEAPGDQELQGIKDYLAGIFVLRNSSRLGIIGQLIFVDLHGLGDDYLKNYVQHVYAVTPQQVQQMAEKYLAPSKMTIVVVGDKSKIAGQLAPYEASGQ